MKCGCGVLHKVPIHTCIAFTLVLENVLFSSLFKGNISTNAFYLSSSHLNQTVYFCLSTFTFFCILPPFPFIIILAGCSKTLLFSLLGSQVEHIFQPSL